jgi:uncharacterized protein (DUF305 family)
MKKNVLFALAGSLLFSACNSGDSGSEATGSDTIAQSDTAMSTGMDTSMNSSMPFMAVMDKMMQDMHSLKMTEDPDHDFAMMMKHHHQGAIEMSNTELSRGTNAEVKQVAQKIIDDSQKDIKDLDSFLNAHQPDSKSDYAKRTMDKMMSHSSEMKMGHSGDIDQQFASMMAMHHQHGIDMSKDYLKSGKEAEVKKVANRAIKTNSEDLKKLNKWKGTSTSDTAKSKMSGHDTSMSGHSQH